jgi:hypothetical protein
MDIYQLIEITKFFILLGLSVVAYVFWRIFKNKTDRQIERDINFTKALEALESAYKVEQDLSTKWKTLYYEMKKKMARKIPINISVSLETTLVKNSFIEAMLLTMSKKGYNVVFISNGSMNLDEVQSLKEKFGNHLVLWCNTPEEVQAALKEHEIHLHYDADHGIVDLINKNYYTSKPAILVNS